MQLEWSATVFDDECGTSTHCAIKTPVVTCWIEHHGVGSATVLYRVTFKDDFDISYMALH